MADINTFGNPTYFNNDVTFYKDVTIGGEFKYDNLSVKNLGVTGNSTLGILTVTGNSTLGILTVTGNSTLGILTVTGNSTLENVGIGTTSTSKPLQVHDSSGRQSYPPPVFRARKTSTDTQTLNNAVDTKVTFTIEDVDSHGYYDISNSRFTPTIPGWYFIESNVRCQPGSCRFDTTLYIDGSASSYASGQNQQGTNDMSTSIATLVYLDGTQYVEVYVNQNSGSNNDMRYNSNAGGTDNINHFSAFLVSPD
jgi:hypothetical protein